MTVNIDSPKVWHDCSLNGGPHVYPWYQYKAVRRVWEGVAEWQFDVINIDVVFCPACGLNLEQAYQDAARDHE